MLVGAGFIGSIVLEALLSARLRSDRRRDRAPHGRPHDGRHRRRHARPLVPREGCEGLHRHQGQRHSPDRLERRRHARGRSFERSGDPGPTRRARSRRQIEHRLPRRLRRQGELGHPGQPIPRNVRARRLSLPAIAARRSTSRPASPTCSPSSPSPSNTAASPASTWPARRRPTAARST